MDPLSIASVAASTVGALIKAVTGAKQLKEGRKIMRNTVRPTMAVPAEIQQNQNLASTMAATGMPSEQYNTAIKNIQQQQVAAMMSSNDRRGGLMSIPLIQEASDNALGSLDAKSAEMRVDNQGRLIQANQDLADWKQKAWDWNDKGKYDQDYGYAMQLLGAGGTNVTGGLDQGAGGIAQLLAGLMGGGSRRSGATGSGVGARVGGLLGG